MSKQSSSSELESSKAADTPSGISIAPSAISENDQALFKITAKPDKVNLLKLNPKLKGTTRWPAKNEPRGETLRNLLKTQPEAAAIAALPEPVKQPEPQPKNDENSDEVDEDEEGEEGEEDEEGDDEAPVFDASDDEGEEHDGPEAPMWNDPDVVHEPAFGDGPVENNMHAPPPLPAWAATDDQQNQQQVQEHNEMDEEELRAAKQTLLAELYKQEKLGRKLTRQFTMDDPIEDMEFELDRIITNEESVKGVENIKNILELAATMTYIANENLGPFLQLDGKRKEDNFVEKFKKSLDNQTSTINALHRKYYRRSNSSPEQNIAWSFITALIGTHIQNKYGNLMFGAMGGAGPAAANDSSVRPPRNVPPPQQYQQFAGYPPQQNNFQVPPPSWYQQVQQPPQQYYQSPPAGYPMPSPASYYAPPPVPQWGGYPQQAGGYPQHPMMYPQQPYPMQSPFVPPQQQQQWQPQQQQYYQPQPQQQRMAGNTPQQTILQNQMVDQARQQRGNAAPQTSMNGPASMQQRRTPMNQPNATGSLDSNGRPLSTAPTAQRQPGNVYSPLQQRPAQQQQQSVLPGRVQQQQLPQQAEVPDLLGLDDDSDDEL